MDFWLISLRPFKLSTVDDFLWIKEPLYVQMESYANVLGVLLLLVSIAESHIVSKRGGINKAEE